ncbi:hypothetical protein [Tunturiibacter gelidiferens]|uniref:hypothetical protein n=1 Tax=Tunturiibacter gelidiferens TaxID=3069689 RepID=UPI003D9BB676
MNANYIMFGLHKNGNVSSYFRKNLVAGVIKNAPCAIFTFAQPVEADLQEVGPYSTGEEFELTARNRKMSELPATLLKLDRHSDGGHPPTLCRSSRISLPISDDATRRNRFVGTL